MNGIVYAIGGTKGSVPVRKVDVYNPLKDLWTSCPDMKKTRTCPGVAVLNDLIYAVGGFGCMVGCLEGNVSLNTYHYSSQF